MSMPFEGSGQGAPQGDPGQQQPGGGGLPPGMNPAWNDVLKEIPSEAHSRVIPHFQGWDQNFQGVQSKFSPYKEFVDAGVDPEHIRIALGFTRALEENPEAVYQAMQEQFGQQVQQQPGQQPGYGQQPQGPPQGQFPGQNGEFEGQGDFGSDGPFAGLPPEFIQGYQALQQQVDTMREIMVQQHQMTQDQASDQELDAFYDDLAKRNEVFAALNKDGAAEPYVNSLLQANYTPQQIDEAFNSFVDQVAQYNNRPKPPVILGAGGFMPERVAKPREMSEEQTKASVLHMLQTGLNPGSR